jgi:hypothetical protein
MCNLGALTQVSWVPLGAVTGPSVTKINLVTGERYSFRVRAALREDAGAAAVGSWYISPPMPCSQCRSPFFSQTA